MQRPAVAEYINKIEHSLWAKYAFPGSRYGLTSSNVAKQCNKWFLKQRRLPIIQVFDHTYLEMLGEWVKRSATATNHTLTYNPAIMLHLDQAKFDARRYTVHLSECTEMFPFAKVVPTKVAWQGNNAFQHAVLIRNASRFAVCTCRQAHAFKAPCKHVLAVCEELRLDPCL